MTGPQPSVGTGVAGKRRSDGHRSFGSLALRRQQRIARSLRLRLPFLDDRSARDFADPTCSVLSYCGSSLPIRDLAGREWDR
jgi:hypothetical protein